MQTHHLLNISSCKSRIRRTPEEEDVSFSAETVGEDRHIFVVVGIVTFIGKCTVEINSEYSEWEGDERRQHIPGWV